MSNVGANGGFQTISRWYYTKSKKANGPVTYSEFQLLWKKNVIHPDTYIYNKKIVTKWTKIKYVPGLMDDLKGDADLYSNIHKQKRGDNVPLKRALSDPNKERNVKRGEKRDKRTKSEKHERSRRKNEQREQSTDQSLPTSDGRPPERLSAAEPKEQRRPRKSKANRKRKKKKKEMSKGIKEGDVVMVRGQDAGIVRFIGETKFATGILFGVELLSGEGEHEGTVDGHQYFKCAPRRGTFCTESTLFKNVAERYMEEEAEEDVPFNLGDYVKLAEDGSSGYVRFLGPVHFANGVHVGVELDVAQMDTGSGTVGGRLYFDALKGHGKFLKPSELSRIRHSESSRGAESSGHSRGRRNKKRSSKSAKSSSRQQDSESKSKQPSSPYRGHNPATRTNRTSPDSFAKVDAKPSKSTAEPEKPKKDPEPGASAKLLNPPIKVELAHAIISEDKRLSDRDMSLKKWDSVLEDLNMDDDQELDMVSFMIAARQLGVQASEEELERAYREYHESLKNSVISPRSGAIGVLDKMTWDKIQAQQKESKKEIAAERRRMTLEWEQLQKAVEGPLAPFGHNRVSDPAGGEPSPDEGKSKEDEDNLKVLLRIRHTIENDISALEELAETDDSALPETFQSQRKHMQQQSSALKKSVEDMISKIADLEASPDQTKSEDVKRRVSLLDETTNTIRQQIEQLLKLRKEAKAEEDCSSESTFSHG